MDYYTLLGALCGVLGAASIIRILFAEKRDNEWEEVESRAMHQFIHDSSPHMVVDLDLKFDDRDKEIAELKAATRELYDKVPHWDAADHALAKDVEDQCRALNVQIEQHLIAMWEKPVKYPYDPMKLPSSVCSDAEWNEIAYGPYSTYSLTQAAIEDLDLRLHGDQVTARCQADDMMREGEDRGRKIWLDWRYEQLAIEKAEAAAAHAAEYDELMGWMAGREHEHL